MNNGELNEIKDLLGRMISRSKARVGMTKGFEDKIISIVKGLYDEKGFNDTANDLTIEMIKEKEPIVKVLIARELIECVLSSTYTNL